MGVDKEKMITIQIDEKKMKEMLVETFKENIRGILENTQLEYWTRSEVHKLLAKEIYEKKIKEMLTDEYINKLLKQAFENYVYQRLDKD